MTTPRTNTLQIRTPEGIVFALLLAGPVTRFLAWTIDLACIAAIGSIVTTLLSVLKLLSVDIFAAVIVVAYFVISIGYAIATEWLWRGQTLGKRLLRLRVMDAQGFRLQFSQIVIRNLLRSVDLLPAFYMVGGLACLLSSRAQRLGDLAANTIVIRTPRISEPDLEQLLAGKYNSFRDHPHLCARLRQRTSPQEATLALQALLRREELDPQARLALFQRMAGYFRRLVDFPQESIEGISDEQYVRNIVDVLFRSEHHEL